MNNQVNDALTKLYPGQTEFPSELRSLASSLNMKSNQLIQNLKPSEEPARFFICTLLAAEQLEVAMNLPAPDIKQAPVAPRTFTKLLNVFRIALFPNAIQPSTPSKKTRSPRKQPTESPSRHSPAVTKRTTWDAIASQADAELERETPQPSPTKKAKIVRGGPKSGDPRKSRVVEICQELGIGENPTDAIIRSYRMYNSLVKDRWGLLCGIIVVIASKSHPRLFDKGPQGFYTKLIRISHTSMNQAKLDEWISWSSRIISDQSWVKRVTNPRSKEANYRNKYKKYSSGVGNMVSRGTA